MTLLEKLNKVNPSLSAAESAEFAGCLLRIMRGLDIQPSLKSLSLQEWIATLKEDGYDVACYIAILRQISISELGTESASILWHYIESVIDQPNGAQCLQDYVINHYPKLEKRINELHASAEQEENDLEHAAGGLSAKAWGGIGLLSVGAVGYGIHRAIKHGKTPVAGAEKALEVEMKIPSEHEIDTKAWEILGGFRDSDIKPGQLLQREGKSWLQWDDIENHESDIKKLIRGFDFHGYAKSELSDLKSKGKWNEWKEKEAADIRAGIQHDFHSDNSDKPRYEKYFSESSDEVAWAKEIEKKGLNGLSWEKMLVSLKGFEEFCEKRFKSRLWAEKVVDAKGYVSDDMINALHNNNPKYVRAQPALDDLRNQAPEIEAVAEGLNPRRLEREISSNELADNVYASLGSDNEPSDKTDQNLRGKWSGIDQPDLPSIDPEAEIAAKVKSAADGIGTELEDGVKEDVSEMISADQRVIDDV